MGACIRGEGGMGGGGGAYNQKGFSVNRLMGFFHFPICSCAISVQSCCADCRMGRSMRARMRDRDARDLGTFTTLQSIGFA